MKKKCQVSVFTLIKFYMTRGKAWMIQAQIYLFIFVFFSRRTATQQIKRSIIMVHPQISRKLNTICNTQVSYWKFPFPCWKCSRVSSPLLFSSLSLSSLFTIATSLCVIRRWIKSIAISVFLNLKSRTLLVANFQLLHLQGIHRCHSTLFHNATTDIL